MERKEFAEKLCLYDLEHVIYLLHEIEARNIIYRGRNAQVEYLCDSDFGIDRLNRLLDSMSCIKACINQ